VCWGVALGVGRGHGEVVWLIEEGGCCGVGLVARWEGLLGGLDVVKEERG
jgi:hypothetical protein